MNRAKQANDWAKRSGLSKEEQRACKFIAKNSEKWVYPGIPEKAADSLGLKSDFKGFSEEQLYAILDVLEQDCIFANHIRAASPSDKKALEQLSKDYGEKVVLQACYSVLKEKGTTIVKAIDVRSYLKKRFHLSKKEINEKKGWTLASSNDPYYSEVSSLLREMGEITRLPYVSETNRYAELISKGYTKENIRL